MVEIYESERGGYVMETILKIRVGEATLTARFHSNVDAMDVYVKLFDALLDGDDGNGFEIGLEVEGND